ncbi:MAG: 16S rRNA (cytosine(1402)-N(4))-methyltransferase RsmH [Candidatus Omnitrophota bacterium]
MREISHYPVMYREVMEYLNVGSRRVLVDCTVGMGAHAARFLAAMGPQGVLVGIDKDSESLALASATLAPFGSRAILVKEDFSHLESVLDGQGIDYADAFLFDLGISTYQLARAQRGFSFLKEGPLDMRMDSDAYVCAADLVNNLSEPELVSIFRKFGEERYAMRIARAIIEVRRKEPLTRTTQLVQVIARVVPFLGRNQRIHPATRVFQALRIAVNRELDALAAGIDAAVKRLNNGGRIAVISFHSLEDRIVKHSLRSYAREGVVKILTKKPLVPGEGELAENVASRSAKLRVAEKNEQ